MSLERRVFMEKALAVAAGLAALGKGIKAWAKGLPSDPEASRTAAGPDQIALPGFAKDRGFALDQALLLRRTNRNFDPEGKLSPDQLSRLLWAANGVNREDGHRTTPSAMATYPVDVYVALPEGCYRFELKEHKLTKVAGDDLREQVGLQPGGLRKSAIKLMYVINTGRLSGGETWMADLEIGCMVQDVYLMAASLNLGSTVFAIVNNDKVTKTLGLKPNQKFRIAQAVGPLRD